MRLAYRKLFHWLIAGLAAVVVAACIVNTVYNNSQGYGATLHDSTIWPVLMWHNGPRLAMAGALGDGSFYQTHVSPIHYLPSLLSYLYPGDWLSFYALVYGLVYGALTVLTFHLFVRESSRPGTVALAGLGAVALFLTQSVFHGAWEMHMEFFSPPLAVLLFQHWQERRYRLALVWLLLNASIREDIAAFTAVILVLLVAAQYLAAFRSDPPLASERLRWGLVFAGASLLYTVGAFLVQNLLFDPFVMDALYFPKADPFGHITVELLASRLSIIFAERMGLWMPMLILVAGAAMLRNPQLLVAPLGLLPYWFIFFIGKFEGGGIIDSYRTFPFVLLMVWPALMALTQAAAARRRYMWLQACVLMGGLSYIDQNVYRVARSRWWPQETAYNTAAYEKVRPEIVQLLEQGMVRASHGILARYPYDFPPWYLSSLVDLKAEDAGEVGALLWFENDRDQALVDAFLAQGKFEVFHVADTKIRLALRLAAP